MAARSLRGLVGIRIRESGLAALICPLELATESVGMAVSDGAIRTGDLIGAVVPCCSTTTSITLAATPSITAATIIAEGLMADVPELMGRAREHMERAAASTEHVAALITGPV